jgi:uncharacterized protein (TIGR02594 family)
MNILKTALSQLGTKEISGSEDNPQIVKYATETGIKGITNDEIPWCSTFVNWCAKKSKLPYSGKANARSWINVGRSTNHPKPGDIVVFWRESPHSWKGHVSILLGFDKNANRVFCIGGNQGNAVSIASYDAEKVLSFRRLEEVKELNIPSPILKKTDKGQKVIQLQLILNHLKYNCGDADGDFGPKTESALKLLQANNSLKIDGIYDNKTQTAIESLMQA